MWHLACNSYYQKRSADRNRIAHEKPMKPTHSNTTRPPQHTHPGIEAAAGDGYHLREHSGQDRDAVEHFIHERFKESYGAHLASFMPRLFSLGSEDDQIVAGFGLREAAHESLFLERYLPIPVEECITKHLGRPIHREHIVEVGHFAGLGAGDTRVMIRALTQCLFREGFHWVCFTGTTALRNAFRRLALDPIELARAERYHLGKDELGLWGNYYDNDPRVLFGNVTEGYAALLNTADNTGSQAHE